jgi:hypothetical protein
MCQKKFVEKQVEICLKLPKCRILLMAVFQRLEGDKLHCILRKVMCEAVMEVHSHHCPPLPDEESHQEYQSAHKSLLPQNTSDPLVKSAG